MSSLKWKNSTGCKKNYKRRSLLLRNGVHLILGYYIRKNLHELRLEFDRRHSAPCFSWAFYYLGYCLVADWVELKLTPFTVWKLREFSLTHFWQKFRESNVFTKHSVEKSSKTRSLVFTENYNFFRQCNDFTKEVTKEIISRKFLSVIAFYSTFPHCSTV